MKSLLLAQDTVLYGRLKNTSALGRVFFCADMEGIGPEHKDCGVVILSDRCVAFETIPYVRERYPEAAIFFMVSSGYENRLFQKIETMCHAHDVNLVYPKQTPEQIIAFITGILSPAERAHQQRVTAFVGAQSKTGTTSIAMAVATRLGMITEARIGLLGLNSFNPGTVYIKDYKGHYLDELKTPLANSMLSPEQLQEKMYKHNHFYYLAGNRDIKKRLHYSIREIHYLVEQAQKSFDLVLVDAGSSYDDALCIQALFNSDTKFLVTNQQLSSLLAWSSAFEQVLTPIGFSRQDFLLVINRYKPSPQLPDARQLAREYGIPCLRQIADVGELGRIVEYAQNLIIDYDEPEYRNDIDCIAKALIKTYRLKGRTQVPGKKAGLIQRLFG